ncbi:ovalbumin-related protein X [Microcaecilia unicolor]|uniref:Ovalbumin-related protein X-like n=2 Tax=Microcaecilia unicolor TaxID=1415580 RepID=A0A6P7YJP7_9AMPH|nr:ovalbumin-related protein X-like [Microcaecilia unicolor]
MDSLTAANASFTFDLYKQLNKTKKDENIFFSPLSIESALAMVLMGAKENTAAEMEKVLHLGDTEGTADAGAGNTCEGNVNKQTFLPPPPLLGQQCDLEGTVHSKFKELFSNLRKSGETCELHIANKLYGQYDFLFIEQYQNCIQKLYMAMLEDVDFKNTKEVTEKINMWVEKETQGKIKDLFTEDSFRQPTVLVLVNAIYFKGKWEKEFNKYETREAEFRLNKRESKPVKMMNQIGKFKLASIPEMHMTILELPYCMHEFSMLILLPDDITDDSTGLEEIENGLTYEKLANWTTSALRETFVDVYLPTFKLEETYDLKSVLEKMGMKDVFSDDAVLTGISTIVGLKVSKVVHKVYVEVNEKGTEAAAATGVVVVPQSGHGGGTLFKADHPFIFLIKHNPTNAIIFYGKYSSP